MSSPPSVAVVGPGRAGTHLAAALDAARWRVALCGRRERVPPADVTVLAVGDPDIDEAADRVAAPLMAHLAGSRGPTPRVRLALHPAMTFPGRADGPVSLSGVGFGLTAADPEAEKWGRRMVDDLGGFCVDVDAGARPLYHAACALASNALVSLEETAAAALGGAGVETQLARSLLGPLVEATARNWRARGAASLSGPVARGDVATVSRHLDLLTGAARSFYGAHVEAWS